MEFLLLKENPIQFSLSIENSFQIQMNFPHSTINVVTENTISFIIPLNNEKRKLFEFN